MGNPSIALQGRLANRFEIEKAVGSGGMGTVYRALDHHSGEAVAIKLLREGGGSIDDLERFAREAQLLSELRHSNIVSYVAHGQTAEGQPFLAMEWLDGHDLGQRLAQEPLTLRDSLRLVEQVADALQLAHARGIAHRDLKPSNLFLVAGDCGRLKLLDFGIARRMAAKQALTRTGAVIGTPEYMAPEQARGVRDLTSASDIFSLGCLLYECLTGEPPFHADHVATVLVRILFEEPVAIAVRCPDVPAEVAQLVDDMLRKDPSQRIADASALRQRMAQLGEIPDLQLVVARPTPVKSPSPFAEEEQVLFSLVVASAADDALSEQATLAQSNPPLAGEAVSPPNLAAAELARRATILAMVRALGAQAEYLLQGALVVRLPLAESAQDQVGMAARVALFIKERWPEATVAVTTGRGSLTGKNTVGDAADRAVKLLARRSDAQSNATSDVHSGVWVDELSARLLGARFAISQTASGALLIGEEKESDDSRRLLGKTTPFVGRDGELAILEAQLNSCLEEATAQVVLLTAPPGFGKSRLRHEFVRRLRTRSEPITVLLGRGDFMSAGASYGILRSAIHKLCGISGSEPIAMQRQRLRQRISEHLVAADKDRVVSFIGELCNVPFPDEEKPLLLAARQEPKIMRESLRRALIDWLAAESKANLVVLVLDDLHWGDESTVSVLDEALAELRSAPFLILAFARPEIHQTLPRLWQSHHPHEIPLKGLGKKACERLIQHVLEREVPPAVLARAIEQSAGNALYLEELIRGLSEGQSGEQSDTVLAMLQARIGRLNAGLRRALRAASVFGQTFWAGGVAAILGLAKQSCEVEDWLKALSEAELVVSHHKSRLSDEKEYAFRHALIRDAAYSLLTDRDQQTGHQLAADFLESAGEPDVMVLAEHCEHAGQRSRAAQFYLRAAETSLEQGDFSGALRRVESGLACEPEGQLLGQLNSIICYIGYITNRPERAEPAQEVAMRLLRPGSLAWCRSLPAAFGVAGKDADTSRAGELVFALLSTNPDDDAQGAYVDAMTFVSWGLMSAAPPFFLDIVLQRMTTYVEQAAPRNPAIRRHLHNLRSGLAMMRQPRPYTHLLEVERALPIAREFGDRLLTQSLETVALPTSWLELGAADKALSHLTAIEAATLQSPLLILVAVFRHTFGKALCLLGNETALAKAERLAVPLEGSGMSMLNVVFTNEVLARVALGRGQLERAVEASQEAMQAFGQGPVWLPPVVAVQIRALIGLQRSAEAIERAEKIFTMLSVMGSVGVYEVEFRVAACEAFHAANDITRAHSELRETLRQIQLRADDITDPTWKQSYLTRNPNCVRAHALATEWGLQ